MRSSWRAKRRSSHIYCRTIVQDGIACHIVANESLMRTHKLENQDGAIGLATGFPDGFVKGSAMDSFGSGMRRRPGGQGVCVGRCELG